MFTAQIFFLFLGTKKFINSASLVCLLQLSVLTYCLIGKEKLPTEKGLTQLSQKGLAFGLSSTWQNECLQEWSSFAAQVIYRYIQRAKAGSRWKICLILSTTAFGQSMANIIFRAQWDMWNTISYYSYYQVTPTTEMEAVTSAMGKMNWLEVMWSYQTETILFIAACEEEDAAQWVANEKQKRNTKALPRGIRQGSEDN